MAELPPRTLHWMIQRGLVSSLVEKAASRRRQHMARERAQCSSRLAGRRRDRMPLALVAEMQERHEHKREGGEGRR